MDPTKCDFPSRDEKVDDFMKDVAKLTLKVEKG